MSFYIVIGIPTISLRCDYMGDSGITAADRLSDSARVLSTIRIRLIRAVNVLIAGSIVP